MSLSTVKTESGETPRSSDWIWMRPVEQVVLTARRSAARSIMITSSEAKAGVSTLALLTTISHAALGYRILYVDLSAAVDDGPDAPLYDGAAWAPGEAMPTPHIEADERGFDKLVARPTQRSRSSFSNTAALKADFDDCLRIYDAIVVDLPHIDDAAAERVNPIPASQAGDMTFLVCAIGRSNQESVTAAAAQLRAAGAHLEGVIANDHFNATPGEGLARNLRGLRWLAPRSTERLARMAEQSRLLN